MMKRLLAVALLAAASAPMTAHAGFGVSGTLGTIENSTKTKYFTAQHYYPTLDYKAGEILVQVAVLDLINSLGPEDDLLFGLNGYYQVRKGAVTEDIMGVAQIGASLDYDKVTEDVAFTTVMLSGRMGAQAVKKMGFGIYIVPEIGVNLVNDDNVREDSMELAVGGQVQISTWLAGK